MTVHDIARSRKGGTNADHGMDAFYSPGLGWHALELFVRWIRRSAARFVVVVHTGMPVRAIVEQKAGAPPLKYLTTAADGI